MADEKETRLHYIVCASWNRKEEEKMCLPQNDPNFPKDDVPTILAMLRFVGNYLLQQSDEDPNEDNSKEDFDLDKTDGEPQYHVYPKKEMSWSQHCDIHKAFANVFPNWKLVIETDWDYCKHENDIEKIMEKENITSRYDASVLYSKRLVQAMQEYFDRKAKEMMKRYPGIDEDEARELAYEEWYDTNFESDREISYFLAHDDIAGAKMCGWQNDRNPSPWEA